MRYIASKYKYKNNAKYRHRYKILLVNIKIIQNTDVDIIHIDKIQGFLRKWQVSWGTF